MISLPPALAPWATQLSVFPPELAVSLGGCVQRLSLAFGPLCARDGAGREDPDGYGGLSRRGNYERLLASEWLLADEAPDEFARRAATNEHAFYALSYRRPAGSRRSVALFDAGPSQLGTPRIAHLASLVALARRASEGRVDFAWGVLQDDREELFDEVRSARALLQARTARPAGAEDLERWLARLGPLRAEDDLWLVGAPRLRGPPLLSRVLVEDVLSPEARAIRVEVMPARRAKREVTLELPPADACVRLLRDPFGVVKVRPRPPARDKPIRVRYEDNRLLVFDDRGGFDVYPVPNSVHAPPGRLRSFRAEPGELLVAGGVHRKRLFGITDHRESHRLRLRGMLGIRDLERPPELTYNVAPMPAYFVLWRQAGPDKSRIPVFVDGAGTLFACRPGSGSLVLYARDVVATCRYAGQLFFAQDAGSHEDFGKSTRRIAVLGMPGEMMLPEGCLDGPDALEVFFGRSLSQHLPLIAVSADRHRWTIPLLVRPEVVCVEEGTVVGVALVHDTGVKEVLLVLDRDETAIWAEADGLRMKLVQARERILEVSASLADPCFAYRTESGRIVVHSLATRDDVLHILPEARP